MKNKLIINSLIVAILFFGLGFTSKEIIGNFKFIGFFNSNFFIALITFLVGSFAICLYIKQKRDYKCDAASIILMEIRHAERAIERMKASAVETSGAPSVLLPTNNWVKYNYLFIKDFDRDELDLVNNFYNQCSVIDYALSQISISKQLEQKGSHIHNALVLIAKDSLSKADFDNKKNNFLEIIQKDPYAFRPAAPIATIIQGLNSLAGITTSTAGSKLKKIARME